MKLVKRLTRIVAILFLGMIVNILVTGLTIQTKDCIGKIQMDNGFYGVSYIISGFPVRVIHVKEFNHQECGFLYASYNDETIVSTVPWVLNWMFWSGIIASIPWAIRKVKKYENSRH